MDQDLLEILEEIFKSSGYNVTISDSREILVENNGHRAYIRYTIQPDYDDLKAFSAKVSGITGIYVMTRKSTGDFNDYAAEHGIYVWDRDELALQIGKLVLAKIERKEIFPIKESAILKEEKNREEPAGKELAEITTGTNEPVPLQELDVPLQELKAEEKKLPSTPELPLEDLENRKMGKKTGRFEATKVDSYDVLNIKSVEPKISKDQAIIIAKPYLRNPGDAILKLVPFWKYSYNVEAEKRIKSRIMTISGDGKGFLNALNKRRESFEIEGIGVPTRIPAVQYEIKRQNIDRKQAEKIILDVAIEENTREMSFNNTDGQAIVYEQRSLKPRVDDIHLEVELVYIPIWEVKGKRNSLEINAYNAEVLEEPADEDAEFL